MAQGHCLIAGPPRSGPSLLGGREPEQRVGAHSLAVLGTRTRRLNRLAGATARVLFALSKALGPPQELFLHLGAWQGCLERSGPPLPLTTTPPPPFQPPLGARSPPGCRDLIFPNSAAVQRPAGSLGVT